MVPRGAVVAAHTFGTVLRSREMNGLSVEEVLMPRGLSLPEHGHEGAQIYFLLEGRYSETARGRRTLLRPGGIWFRPPREPHENAVWGDEAALTLIVTLDERRYTGLARRSLEPRHLRSLLLDEARAEILREVRSSAAEAAMALEGWTLLLLSRTERLLCGGVAEAPEWLADAVQYIERAYREPLSLASVARHVGLHPATLAVGFRRFHRRSVGEYIRELRLRYAREALRRSRQPLAQIAVEAGFYDQAHLGRHFKARFGISPAALRRDDRQPKGGGREPPEDELSSRSHLARPFPPPRETPA